MSNRKCSVTHAQMAFGRCPWCGWNVGNTDTEVVWSLESLASGTRSESLELRCISLCNLIFFYQQNDVATLQILDEKLSSNDVDMQLVSTNVLISIAEMHRSQFLRKPAIKPSDSLAHQIAYLSATYPPDLLDPIVITSRREIVGYLKRQYPSHVIHTFGQGIAS